MKTNKFFLFLATVMVCATSVFISCSNDDDDNNSKDLGDKAVEELKSRLLDEEGNVVFGEKNEQECYEIGIESQADAQELVTQYAKGYTGAAPYTYNLPDNRGTVRVEEGDGGIHYIVKFVVQGIPTMTLQMVDPGYLDNENIVLQFYTYKCTNCEKEFRIHVLAEKKCPYCNQSDYLEKQ